MDSYRSNFLPFTSSSSKVGTSHRSSWWPSMEGHEYLVSYEELPNWHLPFASKFIFSGYRRTNSDTCACVNSLFYWHNELVNIWTHLLPGCIYIALLLEQLFVGSFNSWDDIMYMFMLTSVMYAYLSSALFHCLVCHSEEIALWSVRCDMVGIVAHLVGMCAYIIHSMWKCDPYRMKTAFARIALTFAVLTYACTTKEFTNKRYKAVKPIPFIIFGIVLMYPMWVWAADPTIVGETSGLKDTVIALCTASWCFLLLSVCFYVARFPERWFPGQYDFLGSSHQIFHSLVVVSSSCALLASHIVRQDEWCPVGDVS